MSDIEEIKKYIELWYYSKERSKIIIKFITSQQQTIEKLTKEVEDCEIAITAVSDLVDSNKEDYFNSMKIHVEENAKLLNSNILLANERLKLKEEVEELEKLASNRLIELSKNSNAWSKENTKLKEDNLRIQTDSYHNECNLFISEGMVKDLNQLATDRGNEVHKLKEGLNDIKSQLFDVNKCDTILTSAIEQIIKRTKK